MQVNEADDPDAAYKRESARLNRALRRAAWMWGDQQYAVKRHLSVSNGKNARALRACPESIFMIPMASGEPVHRDQVPCP